VEWNAGIRREMEALQGIAALLLSLAGLAEIAAGRSFPVRWLVLTGLWHAQDVTRHCFVGPACAVAAGHGSSTWQANGHGHEPADAFSLAALLRALALVVRNIAARLGWRSAGQASDESRRDGSHGRLVERLCRSANARLDTS